MDSKTLGLAALIALVLYLGWRVSQHSTKREPIYGGAFSAFFNYLSGLFFVAIFPTVCMSVLVLHPEMMNIAGITFNPIVLMVVIFALLSLLSAILFAIVERAPLEQALNQQTKRKAQGWTEQDAKTSGL